MLYYRGCLFASVIRTRIPYTVSFPSETLYILRYMHNNILLNENYRLTCIYYCLLTSPPPRSTVE